MEKVFRAIFFAVGNPRLFGKWLRTFPFFVESQRWVTGSRNLTDFNLAGAIRNESSDNRLRTFFENKKTGRGIWKWEHYFNVYDRHLKKFSNRAVRLLEIGIYSGGSLEMWKDFFGKDCQIIGVDIEDACKLYESEQVKVVIGDQESVRFWDEFKRNHPPVDIIIDDGGHLPNQQRITFEESFSHLKPGGVFICEDVHGLFNDFSFHSYGIAMSLNGMQKREGYQGVIANRTQQHIGSVHFYPFMVVIEKLDTKIETLIAPKHGTEWQPFL